MRGCLKAVMAFGLMLVLSSPVMAQGGGGGRGGFGGGPVGLLSNPGVQKELKLEPAQIEKATALATATRDKMMGLQDQLSGLDREEAMTKRQELAKPINEEALKTATAFLKPEQVKRLHEIELQQRGARALSDPVVAKKLSITTEQTAKIKSIMDDMQAENAKIRAEAGDDRQAAMQKTQALTKETNTKVMGLMTAEQKSTWKEMTGEPFEVTYQRPAR